MKLEKIVLRGSPKEIGLQHGQLGKKQIINSLETYEKLFHGYQGISWDEAIEEALKHVDAIKAYNPGFLEEMEGVAEGAGVTFEDILALNARSEIALGSYAGKKAVVDGCTVIGTMPPAGTDTIIGQNWDWKGSQLDSLLLLEIHQEHKPIVTMVTEGGLIGKIGFNSEGLGLCFNALTTNKKSYAVPIHLVLRNILESENLSQAIEGVKDGQVAATASLLIGKADLDGSGMMVNLEVSPFGIYFMEHKNGSVVHTNHICSKELLTKLEDRNEFKYDDSTLRKLRAEQLVQIALQTGKEINADLYKEWLKDTFNAPNSINHYANQWAPEHRQMETVFSIVMNLSKKRYYLCIGKPQEASYVEI